jgi:predicted ATPase/class 3 adenylate cyclase
VEVVSAITTFLFTDIEGSSQLWEKDPERMRLALARHDAIARDAVEVHHGVVVKMSGDGVHAAFDDPVDALGAALAIQAGLADPAATHGVVLRVRAGLHAGRAERRDNDFFGSVVNRAARISNAAHGGQVLLSHAVAALVGSRLPQGVTLRELGSMRLRDLASPERIHQVMHATLREKFPALRTLEATPNNLAQQLTTFVGRKRELAEVRALLNNTRLLTLSGAGGIGKTRLSQQLAADVLDDFPDGVWFVELAPLSDPRLVPQSVAFVLGVKEEAGHPVVEALVKYAKDRRLLIVLDNCEHLVQSCAELATQLLQAGPQLKILASSRESLRVAGEATYPVPALAVPDPGTRTTLPALSQYEAVLLFVDRAAAAHPAFQLTEQNAAAVADICQRLDGIPLALELAAARVRTLSVEVIAARLTDRFRLLSGGNRTAMPRQQTLRALIDWSYDLLTEHERALLRRLAVFAGGWTLEGAEAVGSAGDIGEHDVLDLLSNLVDKSLVSMDAEGQRYRLVETVRQYAQERLDGSGEAAATRTRHLAFYLALAETASPELVGPEQGAWLAQLDLEGENLLAAHVWCDHAEGGAELGLRLVFALKLHMFYRGLLALMHRAAVHALARPGAQKRSAVRCRALHAAGQLGSLMGGFREAQGFLDEGLSIARGIGDKGREAMILEELGFVATGQGDLKLARGYMEQALALAAEQGNPRELASASNALAQLCRVEGDLDSAERLYEQALELIRGLDDRESIAVVLLNLAMVSIDRGSTARARAMLQEALAIAAEIGSKPAGQSALEVMAGLAAMQEEWERAARLFGAAEAQSAQTSARRDPVNEVSLQEEWERAARLLVAAEVQGASTSVSRDPADEMFLAPRIERTRASLGAAAFEAAANAGRALGYDVAVAEARRWLDTAR